MLYGRHFQSADISKGAGPRFRMKCLMSSGKYLACVFALLGSAATVGCNSSPSTDDKVEMLRVGVLPGESKAALKTQFSPLVEYLAKELGVPCQLVLHDSYEEFQIAFENAEVDLAWLGGYTFVNVNRSSGAIPLVSRDRDLRFTSYFLVRTDETATELADFRGKRLAFGSRLSTSGHLMPRFFLQSWEIDPEAFFGEIRYTGAHDKTAFAVRDGEVDIGAVSGAAVETLSAKTKLAGEVRILKETPPYVNYVWACHTSVPTAVRTKLRDAFLNLTSMDPAHAEILSRLRAKYFVPVHSDDFRELRSIVDALALAETAE